LLAGVAFVLIATGLALSVSLLWRGFVLVSEKGVSGEDVCSTMFGTSCDATLLNPLSHQLGLPLAGWGIVYFATLSALLLLAWAVGEAFAKEAILAAFTLSVIGVCTSLVLAGMMFFGSVPLCPMCLIIHGLNLVIAPILIRTSGLTMNECLRELARGGKYLIGGTPADPQASRWKAMGFVGCRRLLSVGVDRVGESRCEPKYKNRPATNSGRICLGLQAHNRNHRR
jgi:uncharacterized membrane protein